MAIAFGIHLPLARAAAFFWATSAKSILLACTISTVEFFTSAHLLPQNCSQFATCEVKNQPLVGPNSEIFLPVTKSAQRLRSGLSWEGGWSPMKAHD